uniref:Synaptotagmin n=1 Tax=Pelodiscus sinensis TaxID=13735 RepID=K7G3B3_PELSI
MRFTGSVGTGFIFRQSCVQTAGFFSLVWTQPLCPSGRGTSCLSAPRSPGAKMNTARRSAMLASEVTASHAEPALNATETPSKENVFSDMKDKFMNKLSKLPIPPWAVATILIVAALLLLCCCVCACKKCGKRRKGKKGKDKAKAQINLKEVKELGQSYIDKVQPEIEDLDPALLPEPKEEKPQENLGKLQYSLDYEVSGLPAPLLL